jgi:hypothetical protein
MPYLHWNDARSLVLSGASIIGQGLSMHYSDKQRRTSNLTDLAEQYGESIDNLSMDVLMEAIYNERHAFTARVLHKHETDNKEEET